MLRRAAAPTLAPRILVGGSLLACGYAASAISPSLVGVVVACLLAGSGYARIHSAVQTWATEVAPEARAMTIALFASAMFIGGSVPPWAAADLVQDRRFATIFAIAAVIATGLAAIGAAGRLRFETGRSAQAVAD